MTGIGDESIENLQRAGHAKAVELQRAEISSRRWSLFLKTVFVLFFSAAVLCGLFITIRAFTEKNRSEQTEDLPNLGEGAWQLPDDRTNGIVKNFYRSIGGIDRMSRVRNKLMDGKIALAGRPFSEFYCIENGGQAYIRIGSADGDGIYFVGANGSGRRLRTTSHIGPSDPLSPREAEILADSVLYDELLGYAAFDPGAATRPPFREVGSQRVGDAIYDGVAIGPAGGFSDVYCFDIASGRLMCRLIERGGAKVRVEFSDFREYADGYIYPSTRKVYVDGALEATCVVDRVSVNKDVMFPR